MIKNALLNFAEWLGGGTLPARVLCKILYSVVLVILSPLFLLSYLSGKDHYLLPKGGLVPFPDLELWYIYPDGTSRRIKSRKTLNSKWVYDRHGFKRERDGGIPAYTKHTITKREFV